MPPLESLAPRLRGEFRESVAARSPADNPLRVLFADAMDVQPYIAVLGTRFQSTHARSVAAATRLLRDLQPDILVADLALDDRDALELCQMAMTQARPSMVIVTAAASDRIAAALRAGCHAILVKPFAPNLLCARISRLLRASDNTRPPNGSPGHVKAAGSAVAAARITTNQVWTDLECPQCRRTGAISFDFAERRRMWCACVGCEHVWLARRRD